MQSQVILLRKAAFTILEPGERWLQGPLPIAGDWLSQSSWVANHLSSLAKSRQWVSG